MTSPMLLAGGLACVLLTGRDARDAMAGNSLHLKWVREIVACATIDNAEVWYLSRRGTPFSPFAVDCIAQRDGAFESVPCEVQQP